MYFKKLTLCVLTCSMISTPILGNLNVASAANKDKIVLSNSNSELDKLYNNLDDYKKVEFNKLNKELKLTNKQKIDILKDKEIMDKEPTERWKSAVIRKIAKFISFKVKTKSVAEITDYLFGWEDKLEEGITKFLEEQCGWNHTLAHWTAKTAMFIVF